MTERAGVLLIRDGRVALIERHRDDEHYFVAPGGGIEAGESAADAAVREAREELGLEVRLLDLAATIEAGARGRTRQHYWFAEADTDELGPMTGPEQDGPTNTYARVWVALDDLDGLDIRPSELRTVIATASTVRPEGSPRRAAGRAGEVYVRALERLVGADHVTGFYLGGSVALDAYVPGVSDIDFVCVLDGVGGRPLVRRLRLLHRYASVRGAAHSVLRLRSPLVGTLNGVFVDAADVRLPVTTIRPLASHSGPRFEVGSGFDVNPVSWSVVRDGGVAIRGAAAGDIGLDVEPDEIAPWILRNLVGFWDRWAEDAIRSPSLELRARPRFSSSSAVAYVARMYRTLECGDIVSKDRAMTFALGRFGTEWHPLIRDALAFRRREAFHHPALRRARDRSAFTGRFVRHVVGAARALDAGSGG